MKIGSLFDGSGGFPLAASMCGIEPVWAAEVEPYPIAVTRSRFPNMKHLGSVTEVKGGEVEPVDIVSFGAPCQDLSVAGLRKGLRHDSLGDEETTRSGLFMEVVRIIKEMREATNGEYPRYAIYENVPGAFSSSKGQDWRIVLEELIKIVEPTAVMPEVPKNGWPYADVYSGDGWSLAYRVLDAQYWGVPQRRRRIYLVADFRGQRAGKVSFEREGLRGNLATSGAPWQATAGDVEGGSGAADCAGGCVTYALDQQGGKGGANYAKEVMPTLCSDSHGTPHAVAYSFDSLASNSMKSSNPHSGCRQVEVSKCIDTTNPDPSKNQGGVAIVETVPYTLKIRTGVAVDASGKSAGKGALIQTNKAATLAVAQDQYLFQPVGEQHLFENHSQDSRCKGPLDVCPMRPAQLGTGGNNQPFVVEESPVYCLQGNGIDRADTAGCNGKGWNDETCYTLNTIDRPAVAYAMQGFGDYKESEVASGLKARDYKDSTDLVTEAPIALDRAFYNQGQNAQYEPQFYTDGTAPTLVAKGPGAVAVRYIVRRLTPTECARLQGFPDEWAHPDIKNSLDDEEYAFWLNVRNTHAEINGKATKEYTRDQMLTWYNKLHTDSAEYKLWGNGIALPCALYVMEGIADEPRN